MKHIYLIPALIALAVISQQVERDEIDSQVETVSQFLINLIAKYDKSGAGAIPIEQYPAFLSDVMIEGHLAVAESESITEQVKDMLYNATSGFVKKYNTTEVGVQDFYFDLIKDFTTYLIENEQMYGPVLETFFGDTSPLQSNLDDTPLNQGKTAPEAVEL